MMTSDEVQSELDRIASELDRVWALQENHLPLIRSIARGETPITGEHHLLIRKMMTLVALDMRLRCYNRRMR